jgi:hypothetical protein
VLATPQYRLNCRPQRRRRIRYKARGRAQISNAGRR